MALKIMICGRRRRGKDTFADCIQELVPDVARGSFAKVLKQNLVDMFSEYHDIPLTLQETLERRDLYGPLWQAYGEWCRQYFGENYWVDLFDDWNWDQENIIVTDCRYPNEVEYGRQHGYTIVRIEGPYRGTEQDNRDDNHPSEAHVDTLDVDVVIQNTSTIADLCQKARELLFSIKATQLVEEIVEYDTNAMAG